MVGRGRRRPCRPGRRVTCSHDPHHVDLVGEEGCSARQERDPDQQSEHDGEGSVDGTRIQDHPGHVLAAHELQGPQRDAADHAARHERPPGDRRLDRRARYDTDQHHDVDHDREGCSQQPARPREVEERRRHSSPPSPAGRPHRRPPAHPGRARSSSRSPASGTAAPPIGGSTRPCACFTTASPDQSDTRRNRRPGPSRSTRGWSHSPGAGLRPPGSLAYTVSRIRSRRSAFSSSTIPNTVARTSSSGKSEMNP